MMECRKCGKITNKDLVIIKSTLHNGMYCKKCSSWIKWVSNKDLKSIKNSRRNRGKIMNNEFYLVCTKVNHKLLKVLRIKNQSLPKATHII